MTARWPCACLYAASGSTVRQTAYREAFLANAHGRIRYYAQKQPVTQSKAATATETDPVKSALTIVQSRANSDPLNPPRSTLPPPLTLPTRGSESTPVYWFRIGRAYGTFFKDGLKAVWFNRQAANILQTRIKTELKAQNITDAVSQNAITRSEFQLLARNAHDVGKLPVFGLLLLVFGEWLVFIVPFVPNRVPGTCRIPSQVRGMRQATEERRRNSFRQGITGPSEEQFPSALPAQAKEHDAGPGKWPLAFSGEYRQRVLSGLRDDQLFHLSSSLGLHSKMWDRVQLAPPSSILRRAIGSRLEQICQDDFLILKAGGSSKLVPEELYAACEQRGIDVLDKKDEQLHKSLQWWLARQAEDTGRGSALFTMLFRRLAMRDWLALNVRANQ